MTEWKTYTGKERHGINIKTVLAVMLIGIIIGGVGAGYIIASNGSQAQASRALLVAYMIPFLESMLPQPPPTVELELLWEYKADYPIMAVSISPDGNYIVAVGENSSNDILLFLTSEGNLLWEKNCTKLFGSSYYIGDIYDVAVSQNGECIAVGAFSRTYLLQKDGNVIWEYENDGWYNYVSISDDGEYVAVGTYLDKWVQLLNNSGDIQWKYRTYDYVVDVSISGEGEYIVAGDWDGYAYLFDKQGNLIWDKKIPQYGDKLYVSISSEGDFIGVAGYYFCELGLLDKNGDWVLPYMKIDSSPKVISVPLGGGLLFVASRKCVDVYNSTAQARVGSFEARQIVNDLDITLNGDYLVTGSDDMRVYFLQIA